MTHEDVEAARRMRGHSTLLFITDRCPVGCAHCSVDSRLDSRTITDWSLFAEIVEALCADERLKVVGISGGEPFVERRGLSLASRRLAESGKAQVIYTSGIWAASDHPPAWVTDILRRASCVYLSTDAFHARAVADERYIRAARAIADAGARIVVQVLDIGNMVEQARTLLLTALGTRFEDIAELRPIHPLTHGRGSGVFAQPDRTHPGHTFGPCPLVTAPIVRYDGRVTGCCNESVIMGLGPTRLAAQAQTSSDVTAAMDAFHNDPLLRVIGNAGLGILTKHPNFSDLADEQFEDQCHLCWKILNRQPDRTAPDALVNAIDAISQRADVSSSA